MNYWLLFIPLLSTFTGWFVIWLALQLIFHPVQAKKILGITFQGVFPAQQKTLALSAGKYVQNEFSSLLSIEEKISDPQSFEKVKPLIEEHIDDFLRNKLKEQMPMIGMFIGDKTIATLKTVFMAEIETMFPQILQQFAGNLTGEIDLETLVADKIKAISPVQLEQIFYQNAGNKLRFAPVYGAIIGLLIGFIQLAIVLFVH